MLAMTKLDTYKSIEHFAKHPYSLENKLSLDLLRRRTELDAVWAAFNAANDPESINELTNLYLGKADHDKHSSKQADNNQLTAADLMNMSREEQLKTYASLCAAAGHHIDPSTLLDNRGKDAE